MLPLLACATRNPGRRLPIALSRHSRLADQIGFQYSSCNRVTRDSAADSEHAGQQLYARSIGFMHRRTAQDVRHHSSTAESRRPCTLNQSPAPAGAGGRVGMTHRSQKWDIRAGCCGGPSSGAPGRGPPAAWESRASFRACGSSERTPPRPASSHASEFNTRNSSCRIYRHERTRPRPASSHASNANTRNSSCRIHGHERFCRRPASSHASDFKHEQQFLQNP